MNRTFPRTIGLTLAALAAATAPGTPYDQCGTLVMGLEGCVLFQPDGGGQQVLPNTASPPVGTRARLRGDLDFCASFCFVPCVLAPQITACSAACPADFDGSGGLTVNDIFAFLDAWLGGSPSADFNTSGALEVADIFDFINAWLAGC